MHTARDVKSLHACIVLLQASCKDYDMSRQGNQRFPCYPGTVDNTANAFSPGTYLDCCLVSVRHAWYGAGSCCPYAFTHPSLAVEVLSFEP